MKGYGVNVHETKSKYMENKAMKQRFYCWSSSWGHHDTFNNEKILILQDGP
jgi:hypothetical protein